MNRRTLLIGSAAIAGGGLMVGYRLHQPGSNPLLKEETSSLFPFNAYIMIGVD